MDRRNGTLIASNSRHRCLVCDPLKHDVHDETEGFERRAVDVSATVTEIDVLRQVLELKRKTLFAFGAVGNW